MGGTNKISKQTPSPSSVFRKSTYTEHLELWLSISQIRN